MNVFILKLPNTCVVFNKTRDLKRKFFLILKNKNISKISLLNLLIIFKTKFRLFVVFKCDLNQVKWLFPLSLKYNLGIEWSFYAKGNIYLFWLFLSLLLYPFISYSQHHLMINFQSLLLIKSDIKSSLTSQLIW